MSVECTQMNNEMLISKQYWGTSFLKAYSIVLSAQIGKLCITIINVVVVHQITEAVETETLSEYLHLHVSCSKTSFRPDCQCVDLYRPFTQMMSQRIAYSAQIKNSQLNVHSLIA